VPNDALVVLTTCPDEAVAERLATALLERRQAACVSRLGGLGSWYRWQGRVQRDEEILLLIKAPGALYPAIEATLRELHPYEVPEILALPVAAGLPAYLQWLTDSTVGQGTGESPAAE
jgi:periplasmic divalent cation tolerance protein